MRVVIFISFCLTLIGKVFAVFEVCNPIECFTLLSSVFQPNGLQDCEKITKIEDCASLCLPASGDIAVIKGLQAVKHELCENSQSNQLTNKCVDKHKYVLLSCLYESLTLEAEDTKAEKKLLMCRRASEGELCDRSTLVSCSLHSSYITEVLLGKLFQPMHLEYCDTFAIGNIFDLEVKASADLNSYKNLAVCFDANSHSVAACIPSKWSATNIVINSYSTNKLCRLYNSTCMEETLKESLPLAVESFIKCIQDIVLNKCGELETVYKSVSHSIYHSVVPYCMRNDVIHVSDTESVSLGNYSSELHKYPTIAPTPTISDSIQHQNTSSETVIVHQHVVINVVEHHYNAAMNINHFCHILVLLTSFSVTYFCKTICALI